MKRIVRQALLGVLFTGTAAAVQSQPKSSFVLNGSLNKMRAMPSKIYLVYDSLSQKAPDSALVKAGKYSFKGTIDFPTKAYLTAKLVKGIELRAGSTPTMAALFIDKGTITAVSTGEVATITVTGSAADKDYHTANQSFDLLMDTIKKGVQVVRAMDNDWLFLNAMTATMVGSPELGKKGKIDFVSAHPAAGVNPYLLNELLAYRSTASAGYVDRLDSFYQAMPLALQQSQAGRKVGALLKNELKAAIGHKASDFSLNDTLGHSVALSSFKGKYVLVQFWNNDDPGMRPMLSAVVQTYQAYKDKGLDVLGVSVGLGEEDWKQALRGYHFTWKNVVDIPGIHTVGERYGITRSMDNVLVDPNGVIVARSLSYSNLGEKIAAILD
jgi:peroxiredoxin